MSDVSSASQYSRLLDAQGYMRRLNLSGQTYGRWLVLDERQGCKVLCRCSCGTERFVYVGSLQNGSSKSCGCAQRALGGAVTQDIWRQYRGRAQHRQLEWRLTLDQFTTLVHNDCFYCGGSPSNVMRRAVVYNGIDRLDNEVGYTPENCVTCCATCNRAKSTLSLTDFRKWIHRLCEFQS